MWKNSSSSVLYVSIWKDIPDTSGRSELTRKGLHSASLYFKCWVRRHKNLRICGRARNQEKEVPRCQRWGNVHAGSHCWAPAESWGHKGVLSQLPWPRHRSLQSLVMENNHLLCSCILWVRNSDSAPEGQHGPASRSLGPPVEDSKAMGWDHLQAHSLPRLVTDAGCGPRP